ncbi:BRO1 domain-containing protein BROX-like [Lineus longissimus]|uniref:BRO1 domain-containing protein BROX-like n=1 Tax=Lineus longissimus TaxID=88925 RepID=UPI002B4F1E2C
MAHWFHRNPLKATSRVSFELRQVASTTSCRQLCSDLERSRNKLLDILADPNIEIATLEEASKYYLSLLHGLVKPVGEETTEDSKLRHAVKFRWTNTLCGGIPCEHHDSVYEVYCIVFDMGLWYTKHAAKIAAASEKTSEEEAKEVHKCLRTAAGLFDFAKNLIAKLLEAGDKSHDTDTRVVEAYILQCKAEAQEVAIARAIERELSLSLRSSLALETARTFEAADLALVSQDEKIVLKWRKYFQLKHAFYMAYAYTYHGEMLLKEDKCGEAIRSVQESVKYIDKADAAGKEYANAKGPGTTCKPWEHAFFRKLRPDVGRTLEKCERENGFIYHQKVPAEIPELELKAEYGLAKPEPFVQPEPHKSWTKTVYDQFDITKNDHLGEQDPKKKKEQEGDIPAVKEADIPQKNTTSCVIS